MKTALTALSIVAAMTVVHGATTKHNTPNTVTQVTMSADGGSLHRPALPKWMTRPCATEDSLNCYWNAKLQGNGKGKSFYVRRMPHTGKRHPLVCIHYVKHSDYDQCWRYAGGGL